MVRERLDPVNGFARVPEKAGLGVTLDRDELERLENLELPAQERWILKSRFANGTRMYHSYEPGKSGHFLVRPDWRGGQMPMSYAAPIETEYWDNDDTPEFQAMLDRIEAEGMVLEQE